MDWKHNIPIWIGSGTIGAITSSLGYGWYDNNEFSSIGIFVNICAITLWVVIYHLIRLMVESYNENKNNIDTINQELNK